MSNTYLYNIKTGEKLYYIPRWVEEYIDIRDLYVFLKIVEYHYNKVMEYINLEYGEYDDEEALEKATRSMKILQDLLSERFARLSDVLRVLEFMENADNLDDIQIKKPEKQKYEEAVIA